MKFPVQPRDGRDAICPICKGLLPSGPSSFAFVNGGALKQVPDGSAGMDDDLLGFLSIGFHGAHSEGNDEASACVYIADDVPLGQYEYTFCSTACLRGFFNRAVDELESRLAKGTSKS